LKLAQITKLINQEGKDGSWLGLDPLKSLENNSRNQIEVGSGECFFSDLEKKE
jgi:hypothetical protein